MNPVSATAQVVARARVGAYTHLVLDLAQAAHAQPGQFAAVAVGGSPTAMILRRAFSIHRADPLAGTLELIVAPHGPGSTWVTRRQIGDDVPVVAPLGRPYRAPAVQPSGAPGPAVLVGGGYGSAPLAWWGSHLRAAGHEVVGAVGAGDAQRLFDVRALEGVCTRLDVSTDDGSAGRPGRVTDRLGELIEAIGARDVYACGPMAMLQAVTQVATARGATAWCTVEESMACGVGVCMTCVLPMVGADGVTRMTRTCTDGPTVEGSRLRWDAIRPGGGAQVPADALGAARVGGH